MPRTALPSGIGIATAAIHGGRGGEGASGSLLPPIVQSTTFAQSGIGTHTEHTYSRASTTRRSRRSNERWAR